MPYTVANLRNAIDEGNLPEMRRIIQERNALGRPTVNVNNIHDNTYNNLCMLSAELYVVGQELPASTRFDMLNILLSARDNDNNPLVNLVAVNGMERGLLGWVINQGKPDNWFRERFTQAQIRGLVDSIINLRYADGRRVYQFYAESIGPLIEAVELGDPEVVRSLLDLRDEDGHFTIDVNAVITWGGVSMTAMDVVHRGKHWMSVPGHVPNQQILDLLRQFGGVRYQDLGAVQRVVRPRRVRPVPRMEVAQEPVPRMEVAQGHAAAQFDQNSQNVHSPAIERTVDASIDKLLKRYGWPETKVTDIELFINHVVNNEKPSGYQHIQSAFQFLKASGSAIHPPTKLTLLQILKLVWTGINDRNAPPPDEKMTDAIITLRQGALLDQLKDIATTYQDPDGTIRPSCIGGARNRLLMALHKAHPDVSIAPTGEALQAMFFDMAVRFEQEELLKKTRSEQLKILSCWDELDGDQPFDANAVQDEVKGEPPFDVRAFHEEVKRGLQQTVRDFYANVLSQRYIDEFFAPAQFYSFPQPIPHVGLRELLNKIQMLEQSRYPCRALIVNKNALIEVTKQIFNEDRGSYDADLIFLKSKCGLYDFFEKIDEIIHTLASAEKEASIDPEQKTLVTNTILESIKANIQTHDFSSGGNLNQLSTNILEGLNEVKKTPDFKKLEKSVTWQTAIATLKNVLLLVPIFGWAVLLYRACRGPAFFDSRNKAACSFENLCDELKIGADNAPQDIQPGI